jgi:hypothetical protein
VLVQDWRHVHLRGRVHVLVPLWPVVQLHGWWSALPLQQRRGRGRWQWSRSRIWIWIGVCWRLQVRPWL